MRIIHTLAITLLPLLLTACSGIETRAKDTAEFAAKGYRYYSWRSEPLQNPGSSNDRIYVMDPIVRRAVDKNLKKKGYTLNPEQAQFSIDYLQAPGLRMGATSDTTSNISLHPSVVANRQVDGAVVDNAHALGGVKETSNIAIQINDMESKHEVWHVIITKFVENVNQVDPENLEIKLGKAIAKGLDSLPEAAKK